MNKELAIAYILDHYEMLGYTQRQLADLKVRLERDHRVVSAIYTRLELENNG